MKKKVLRIISLILLIAGLGFVLFPVVSNWINNRLMDQVIVDYQKRIVQINRSNKSDKNSKLEDLYTQMVAYNEKLYKNGQKDLVDPFSYEQPSFDLTQFGLKENIIGYLTVPKMDLHVPIYLGASKVNMKKGAAQLTQTSLPVGGKNTNSVIAGHRGMITKEMFRNIQKLEIGDDVTVTNFREELHYKVKEIKVIQPNDISKILIQPGLDLVTLITCHPYPSNNQRYVVYCERV